MIFSFLIAPTDLIDSGQISLNSKIHGFLLKKLNKNAEQVVKNGGEGAITRSNF